MTIAIISVFTILAYASPAVDNLKARIRFFPPEVRVEKIDEVISQRAFASSLAPDPEYLSELIELRERECRLSLESCFGKMKWNAALGQVQDFGKLGMLHDWWSRFLDYNRRIEPKTLAQAWEIFVRQNGTKLNLNAVAALSIFIRMGEEQKNSALVSKAWAQVIALKPPKNLKVADAALLYAEILSFRPLSVERGRIVAQRIYSLLSGLPSNVLYPEKTRNKPWEDTVRFASKIDLDRGLMTQMYKMLSARKDLPAGKVISFAYNYGWIAGDYSLANQMLEDPNLRAGNEALEASALALTEATMAWRQGKPAKVAEFYELETKKGGPPEPMKRWWFLLMSFAWVSQNDLDKAMSHLKAAVSAGMSVDLHDELAWRLQEARIWIRQGKYETAITTLENVRPKLQAEYRGSSQADVEVLMELMIANSLHGDKPAARKAEDSLKKILSPGKSFPAFVERFQLISGVLGGDPQQLLPKFTKRMGEQSPLVSEAAAISELMKKPRAAVAN